MLLLASRVRHRYGGTGPHQYPLPEPWQQLLGTSFTQLLLVHMLRQEWLVPTAHSFVSAHLVRVLTAAAQACLFVYPVHCHATQQGSAAQACQY